MEINKDKQIFYSVSNMKIPSKESFNQMVKSMTFKTKEGDIRGLLYDLTNGYAITHIFNPKKEHPKKNDVITTSQKCEDNYYASFLVFIDVDKTELTDFNDFKDRVTPKPTMIYPSMSNMTEDKGLRLHLLYAFDEAIKDKDTYRNLARSIRLSVNESTQSECDTRLDSCSYLILGNNNKNTDYCDLSGNVYNVNDIEIKEDGTKQKVEGVEAYSEELTELYSHVKTWESNTLFLKAYGHRYKSIYRMEGVWESFDVFGSEVWIQKTTSDFFDLFQPKSGSKVLDGQHRRQKLFTRIALKKVLKKDTTAEELFYNAIADAVRYFQLDDKDLTPKWCYQSAIQVAKMTVEEIEEKYKKVIEDRRASRDKKYGDFIFNFLPSDMSKWKAYTDECKEQWRRKHWVSSRSASWNAKALGCSLKTATRLRDTLGESRESREQLLLSQYDPTKSLRVNAKELGVSKSTVERWSKRLQQ